MSQVICAMELTVSFFMLAILYGIIFETKLSNTKNKLFMTTVALTFCDLLIDGFSWFINGNVELSALNLCLSLLSICGSFIIHGTFCMYVLLVIRDHRPVSLWYGYSILILLVIGIILSICLCATGLSFRIVDGYYVSYPIGNIPSILQVVCVILMVILIAMNAKYIGRHDTIVIMVFYLIPSFACWLEIFLPDYSFSLIGVSLSLMLVYMFIQSKEISQSKLRERILNEATTTDTLTQLKNRRSYELALDTVVPEMYYCVLFADVNGLKYTNDNFGHEAGDKLLLNFKRMMTEHFNKEYIYRISGDEFVIILPDVSKERYEEILNSSRICVASNASIASVGGGYGLGEHIREVVKEAENSMYDEKDKYYATVGRGKRRV